jgi:hypothetical protein
LHLAPAEKILIVVFQDVPDFDSVRHRLVKLDEGSADLF